MRSMKWGNVIARLRAYLSGPSFDPEALFGRSEKITPRTVEVILSALTSGKAEGSALSTLAAVLLCEPELANCVPLTVLDLCGQSKSLSPSWQNVALLLLHTSRRQEIAQWLRSKWRNDSKGALASWLLPYVSDWFPSQLDTQLLESISQQTGGAAPLAVLLERQLFRENKCPITAASKPAQASSESIPRLSRLLVVHNIVDGLGDEIVRTNALMQAFLDGFPDLQITLFTDRQFLYDHPRIQALSISDSELFKEELKNNWDGIVNFFEPYLPSNSYNPLVQTALQEQLEKSKPSLNICARKGVNHFVFESVLLNGTEFVSTWGLKERLIPLNYHTTMRLIVELGLPLRFGENQPASGCLQSSNPQTEVAALWQDLRAELASRCAGEERSIALVNIFGGQNQLKGFQPDNYALLSQIASQLIAEGYNLVFTSNGQSWGGVHEIDAAIDSLPEKLRKHAIHAPLSDAKNPQEMMRRIKYFAAWSDTVVTIEGWMMHLTYAIGKPYKLLKAPYSYSSEWYPHGRSANQGTWMGYGVHTSRPEFSLANGLTGAPLILHYPEKDLLRAALEIWGIAGDRWFAPRILYWLGSTDKDIRRWAISAIGSLDAINFQAELLRALEDCNREVRAAAATALLRGGQDLSQPLGPDWRNVLNAYELLGDYRFQDLLPFGHAAFRPLRACLNRDEEEVNRDATIMLESMQMSRPDTNQHWTATGDLPAVLILTPVKNAALDAEEYFARLRNLAYPLHLISLGILEGDSEDNSYEVFKKLCDENRSHFQSVRIWKKDFGYQIPKGTPRWEPSIQLQRRTILARSRNHLLFHALEDEDWVLWLDADVIEFPVDIIQRLLSYKKDIVQPHCVKKYCGPSFDLNAWRDKGRLFMHDLRPEGEITPIDAVGGTMLLIRADCHRDGLVFPPFLYGKRNAKIRKRNDINMPGEEGEVETEGLGILASDMNLQCWGLPHLEIIHADR